MQRARLKRLVRLLGVLQAGKPLGASELAKACVVSRRTLFRDLELLRSAGVPFEFDDKQQCYSIPSGYFLPPTNFTAEEAIAVSVLCSELGSPERMPFQQAAQTAAMKLESALPSSLRDLLRQTTPKLHIRPTATNRLVGQESIFADLRRFVTQHRAVKVAYDSFSENQLLTTTLRPYRLLFSKRSWYVIGHSSQHKQVRTFNIGRIRELTPLDQRFHVPRQFSLERYLRNAWQLIAEDGPDVEVVIRFAPMVARNVAEVAWHKSQRIEFETDGSLIFRVTVSGVHEISWWILGYGDQAEVLEPRVLRDAIAERARAMAARYES